MKITEENELELRAKKHKKKQKGKGWFVHPNAGNVEYNVAMFNHLNGTGDYPTVSTGSAGDGGGEGCCEDLNEEKLKREYVYKGPVYYKDDNYVNVNIGTFAISEKQAVNNIRGQLFFNNKYSNLGFSKFNPPYFEDKYLKIIERKKQDKKVDNNFVIKYNENTGLIKVFKDKLLVDTFSSIKDFEEVYGNLNNYNIMEENYMTNKQIKESLLRIDDNYLSEKDRYLGVADLFESVQLSQEDKQTLTKAIQRGDDAELISAFLDSKLTNDDKKNPYSRNENLNEDGENINITKGLGEVQKILKNRYNKFNIYETERGIYHFKDVDGKDIAFYNEYPNSKQGILILYESLCESNPEFATWVFDGDDQEWKIWGGNSKGEVDDDFLNRINHPKYPNPKYNVEHNYTDVVVLPNNGSEPNDGRPVKLYEAVLEDDFDWKMVSTKSVPDSDGFLTDYTWYVRFYVGPDAKVHQHHIFMFGDNELYRPDEDYADWECDDFEEAKQWFNDYNGFLDDIDESLKEGRFVDTIDIILLNDVGSEIDRISVSHINEINDAIYDWSLQPGDIIKIEYAEHELNESIELLNNGYTLSNNEIGLLYYDKEQDMFIEVNEHNIPVNLIPGKVYRNEQEHLEEDFDNNMKESRVHHFIYDQLAQYGYEDKTIDKVANFVIENNIDVNKLNSLANGVWECLALLFEGDNFESQYETFGKYWDDADTAYIKDCYDIAQHIIDGDYPGDVYLDEEDSRMYSNDQENEMNSVQIENENLNEGAETFIDSYGPNDEIEIFHKDGVYWLRVDGNIVADGSLQRMKELAQEELEYISESLKEGIFGDYKDYDGWKQEDIDLHKSINWKERNYEEYDCGRAFNDKVVLYGYQDEPVYADAEFHKFLRPNPIFPPYYRPIEKKPFDIDVPYVGPMYDGTSIDYDVHDRYETQSLYNRLSEDYTLKETLLEPSQELIDEFEAIMKDNGFEIEGKGKSLFDTIWYQVRSNIEFTTREDLIKLIDPIADKLEELEAKYHCPITFNFGPDKNNMITGGLDINKMDGDGKWTPYRESLDESIVWPNGMEVSDLDLSKALDYMYGIDRNPDNDTFTEEQKQRAVNYYIKKHEPSPYDENLNESYSMGYVKTKQYGDPLIYSVTIGNDNTNANGELWREVHLNLVCGWEYIDDWSDRMGWADAENWVDDVQSETLVWYPEIESFDSLLEDNELERCSKPTRIFHYNEEKDGWEILKESLNEDYNSPEYKDAESIISYLDSHNYQGMYDLVDYGNGPLGTSIIKFYVDGDWKHEHIYFNELVKNWAKENNRKIFKIDNDVIEDTGSDWYESYHTVYVTKDDESFDKLNDMSKLFMEEGYGGAFDIEDDQFFTREELNEFGSDLDYELNMENEPEFNLQGIYIDNNILEIDMSCDDYQETFYQKIDMRAIRKPNDLYKYLPGIKEEIVNKFKEDGVDFEGER